VRTITSILTLSLLVPLGSVTRLDVHRGQKRNVGMGAFWGGLIGVALGVGAVVVAIGPVFLAYALSAWGFGSSTTPTRSQEECDRAPGRGRVGAWQLGCAQPYAG